MPDERVDRAIYDFFGKDISLLRIGEQFDESTSYPLKTRPSEDGHYWDMNGTEGVIIKLPAKPTGQDGLLRNLINWWKKSSS
jgi:hypothetical protein